MIETPTRLVAEISDRLITAIATGEFLPGSRLPAERDLAVQLRVGRTSVRAALLVLHRDGLIETLRGRGGGSYVRRQWADASHGAVLRTLREHWDELSDRLEAVRRLRGAIARAAAEHRDEHDVDVLAEKLDDFRRAPSGRSKQAADAGLHLAVTDAAKNTELKTMLLDLERRISIAAPTHVWGQAESVAITERRSAGEHAALVAAITAGRADDAEAIAREHGRIDLELLEAACDRAVHLEEQPGVPPTPGAAEG